MNTFKIVVNKIQTEALSENVRASIIRCRTKLSCLKLLQRDTYNPTTFYNNPTSEEQEAIIKDSLKISSEMASMITVQ
jgi:hypothetical protein